MKFVVCDDPSVACDSIPLVPNRNLITGVSDFKRVFGTLTSLEEDLLTLGAAVFAADLASKRGDREAITRSIELVVPVINFGSLGGFEANSGGSSIESDACLAGRGEK